MTDLSERNSNLGENISREWSKDINKCELFYALQIIKSDPQGGLDALKKLAEDGSSLSMMYLGDAYRGHREGIPKDQGAVEYWMERGAKAGSIEAAYIFADCLLKSGRELEAIAEYENLSKKDFSPAFYVLGHTLFYGRGEVHIDKEKAIEYLNNGKNLGHLYCRRMLALIMIFSKNFFRGIFEMARTIPEKSRLKKESPGTDRLRR